ncbi:hypothetical protein ACFRQM_51505 [Streptomyces sp. NPDC056831]|uniref:hypothetical protein n=1 Tax=Streptomyces sp. NPDC056831 TaxID=3345954 RepID=UPI0036775C4B
MNGDEQLLRGRVYGHDHDDPNPGPLPHQTYAALVGGPLDGLLLDITGWRSRLTRAATSTSRRTSPTTTRRYGSTCPPTWTSPAMSSRTASRRSSPWRA